MNDQKAAEEMVYCYVQEGGSSTEIYLHTFDTLADAEDGRIECAASAYRTSNIVEVPKKLADQEGFHDTIQEILMASLDFEYAEEKAREPRRRKPG